jgi:catechol 2,3-dioxygenase-like lactoylglutathione lyase family enzyme
MASYVEHIQYVCSDIEKMAAFYATVFDWPIRGRGTEVGPERTYDWVHIGTDESYVAFRTPYNGVLYDASMRSFNDHVGIVVDDLAVTIARLEALGGEYVRKGKHPYRDRIYARDPDNNEVEVICYRSSDPRQRNDYSIDAG